MAEAAPNPIRISHHSSTDTKHSFTVLCHTYYIRTTVTSDEEVVRDWLHRIRDYYPGLIRKNRLVVGIGVQWCPNSAVPATLQLCACYQCLIIQLHHLNSVPVNLRDFLSNTAITFVGVSVSYGGVILRNHKLPVSRLIELRDVANERRGILTGPVAMEPLAERILELPGIVKSPLIGSSEWDAKVLSDEQVEYAVIDAFISWKLGIKLQAWNWNRMVY